MQNLDYSKAEIRDYYENGGIDSDLSIVYSEAKINLDKYRSQGNCVLFDVDDTLASTFEFIKPYDYGWSEDAIEKSLISYLPPIKQTIDFYNYTKENYPDIKIFILTSRRDSNRNFLLELLKSIGITSYTGLITRPNKDVYDTIKEFKFHRRKELEESGYPIILNIADQPGDFWGGVFCAPVKLPNYLYDISGY